MSYVQCYIRKYISAAGKSALALVPCHVNSKDGEIKVRESSNSNRAQEDEDGGETQPREGGGGKKKGRRGCLEYNY